MNVKTIFPTVIFLFLSLGLFSQGDNAPYMVAINEAGAQVDFPLAHSDYDVSISGVIGDVTLTQVYSNADHTPIEAVYVFPLHDESAIYDMEMHVGERIIKAEIKEKSQARQEYAQAKAEGRRTSLLEQHRPNVFEMNVANIMPGETVKVQVKYTQKMTPVEGKYQFVAPLVVGPRPLKNNTIDF